MSEMVLIHPQALVSSEKIGPGTSIDAFARIDEGAVIGDYCRLGASCFIQDGARLGLRVVVGSGVNVWAGVTLEDGVFIGPGAILTNDRLPRSRRTRTGGRLDRTLIREGATIGAGAILIAPLTIGSFAFIGAGTVLTKDVVDHAFVFGNPGRRQGWACECGGRLNSDLDCPACALRFVPKAGGGLARR